MVSLGHADVMVGRGTLAGDQPQPKQIGRMMDDLSPDDLEKGAPYAEQPPRALHHRLYPYMDELVQYATERADDLSDPDAKPWIVRDRSTALRNERQNRGRALFRTWIPTDWQAVNTDD